MKTLLPLLLTVAAAGCGSSIPGAKTLVPAPTSTAEPTPAPTEGVAPVITGITPAMGSPAMEVETAGTGLAGASVFFAGMEAEIVSASATSIVVHPAASTPGARGQLLVTVVADGETSNGVPFQLFAAGDVIDQPAASPSFATDVHIAATGATLVADESAVFSVDANGWTRKLATLPEGVSSMREGAAGKVVLAGANGIHGLDPVTGSITSIAGGAWSAAAVAEGVLLALRADGSAIEAIPGGEWIALAGECGGATGFAVAGGVVFVATGSAVCVAPATSGAQADVVELTETVWSIDAIRAEGDRAVISGYFADHGDAIAAVEADGSTMIRALLPMAAPAFAVAQNGTYRIASAGGQALSIEDVSRVVTTSLSGVTAQAEIAGRIVVAGGAGDYQLPFVAEIGANGSFRVVASSEERDCWTSLTGDATALFVAAIDESRILRIDALSGEVATAVDHGSAGEIVSMLRLDDGSFLVSDGVGVAKYDAQGGFGDYIAEIGGAAGMAVEGGQVWIAAGNTISRVALTGGDIEAVVDGSSLGGLSAITLVNGAVFAANETEIVELVGGALEVRAQAGEVLGLASDSWGRILVADGASEPYLMLP